MQELKEETRSESVLQESAPNFEEELIQLRNELARRDADALMHREAEQAKNELACAYPGFSGDLGAIESMLEEEPLLSELPVKERYRLAYLVLEGTRRLSADSKSVSDEEILAQLHARPELIDLFAGSCRGKKELSCRLAVGEHGGIPAICEKTPGNLKEARSAALRYAKRTNVFEQKIK